MTRTESFFLLFSVVRNFGPRSISLSTICQILRFVERKSHTWFPFAGYHAPSDAFQGPVLRSSLFLKVIIVEQFYKK